MTPSAPWLPPFEDPQPEDPLAESLAAVPIPEGLRERLAQVPERCPVPPWRRRRLTVAAASILFLLGAAAWFLSRPPAGSPSRDLRALAALVLEDHLEEPPLTVRTPDPAELRRRLAGSLPFLVLTPPLGQGWRLLGGRRCSLGGRPLAYSRWVGSGTWHSLFQFRPEDFDLPEGLAGWTVDLAPPAVAGPPCRVRVWTDGANGFALVSAAPAPVGRAR